MPPRPALYAKKRVPDSRQTLIRLALFAKKRVTDSKQTLMRLAQQSAVGPTGSPIHVTEHRCSFGCSDTGSFACPWVDVMHLADLKHKHAKHGTAHAGLPLNVSTTQVTQISASH